MNYLLTLNDRAEEIHRWAINEGFWKADDPLPYKFALAHTEVSEATTEYRKENAQGVAEECIDGVMRLLDICEFVCEQIDTSPEQIWRNKMAEIQERHQADSDRSREYRAFRYRVGFKRKRNSGKWLAWVTVQAANQRHAIVLAESAMRDRGFRKPWVVASCRKLGLW